MVNDVCARPHPERDLTVQNAQKHGDRKSDKQQNQHGVPRQFFRQKDISGANALRNQGRHADSQRHDDAIEKKNQGIAD